MFTANSLPKPLVPNSWVRTTLRVCKVNLKGCGMIKDVRIFYYFCHSFCFFLVDYQIIILPQASKVIKMNQSEKEKLPFGLLLTTGRHTVCYLWQWETSRLCFLWRSHRPKTHCYTYFIVWFLPGGHWFPFISLCEQNQFAETWNLLKPIIKALLNNTIFRSCSKLN